MKIWESVAVNYSSVKTNLHEITDHLIKTLLPSATRNNNLIVNDISPGFVITRDERTIASVISGVIFSVINNARDSCIHVSAKKIYEKMMVITVKDSNSYNTYGIACSLQDVLPVAQEIGGDIDISNEHENITSIVFSFPIPEYRE